MPFVSTSGAGSLAYGKTLDAATMGATAAEISKIKPTDYPKYFIKLADGADIDRANYDSPQSRTVTLPSSRELEQLKGILTRDAEIARTQGVKGNIPIANPRLKYPRTDVEAKDTQHLTPRQKFVMDMKYESLELRITHGTRHPNAEDVKAIGEYSQAVMPIIDFAIAIAKKREASAAAASPGPKEPPAKKTTDPTN